MTELIVPSGPYGSRVLNSDAVDALADKLRALTGSLVLLVEGATASHLTLRPLDEVLAMSIPGGEAGIVEDVYPDNCCGYVDLQLRSRWGSAMSRNIPYNAVHLLQRAVA